MKQTEKKVNELASQVMQGDILKSFLNLDLESKLTGIATFAHLSGDCTMRDKCLNMIKILKPETI